MKKFLISLVVLGLGLHSGYAQNRTEYKKERNLIRVVKYYDNGQIAEKGYFKNSKLHGDWVSYSETGSKLAQGQFLNGKKTGKWFFWHMSKMTEVTFKDNKATGAVVWEKGALVAVN